MKKTETIEEMCSYREPIVVREKYAYWSYLCGGYITFPICPRCGASFEIEYINFCSSCGQRLKWLGYSRAKVRCAGDKNKHPIPAAKGGFLCLRLLKQTPR